MNLCWCPFSCISKRVEQISILIYTFGKYAENVLLDLRQSMFYSVTKEKPKQRIQMYAAHAWVWLNWDIFGVWKDMATLGELAHTYHEGYAYCH